MNISKSFTFFLILIFPSFSFKPVVLNRGGVERSEGGRKLFLKKKTGIICVSRLR